MFRIDYIGIDTDLNSIRWCKKFLSPYNLQYRFLHVPAYNARYNKEAEGLKTIPIAGSQFDLVFLNSVFSHMLEGDIIFYLKEFYRLLKPCGGLYLTAFLEHDVPRIEENPTDYINQSIGSLHRVRYEINHFNNLLENANFSIEHFFHQHEERTKQSVVVAKRK